MRYLLHLLIDIVSPFQLHNIGVKEKYDVELYFKGRA